jgi:hypothetical protein
MLLPSILRILDQSQVQSKKVIQNVESGFEAELSAAAEEETETRGTGPASAGALDSPKPLNLNTPHPAKPPAGHSLEELLRIITKFQKANQKRVVDVFE